MKIRNFSSLVIDYVIKITIMLKNRYDQQFISSILIIIAQNFALFHRLTATHVPAFAAAGHFKAVEGHF